MLPPLRFTAWQHYSCRGPFVSLLAPSRALCLVFAGTSREDDWYTSRFSIQWLGGVGQLGLEDSAKVHGDGEGVALDGDWTLTGVFLQVVGDDNEAGTVESNAA